jgi:zinc protease
MLVARLARLFVLAAVLVAAGCASTASRATVFPRPPGDDADLPPVTREVLPNGLRLIIQEHRAADVAAVYLWVGVGVRYESLDGLGYSHFQEHMLFKGTDTWGPGHIDRAVEGVGGRSNAVTSFDYTTYYIIVPSEGMDTALGLLADMAFRSKFDPVEIDREREVIFEEARIETDNPRTAIVRQLYGLVFGDHPYGRPVLGTPATMKAGTRERLMAYNKRYYVPDNMALIVVGPARPDAVRAAVMRTFGQVAGGGNRPEPVPVPRPLATRVSRDVERPEEQAFLGLGWLAPASDNPDGFALDLLVNILGGMESSRLATSLRDRDRLVSAVSMNYAALQGGGITTLRAECEAADLATVETRIVEAIRRIQDEGVTEEERQLAVTKAESEHAFAVETSEGLAYNYGIAEMTWKLEEELRYVERLRSVTREQIRDTARRYLSTTAYVRLAFLPKKKG